MEARQSTNLLSRVPGERDRVGDRCAPVKYLLDNSIVVTVTSPPRANQQTEKSSTSMLPPVRASDLFALLNVRVRQTVDVSAVCFLLCWDHQN